MSLIQDALKRQQEEMANAEKLKPEQEPDLYSRPPENEAPPEDENKVKSNPETEAINIEKAAPKSHKPKIWAAMAGVVVLVLLVVGSLIWLITFAVSRFAKEHETTEMTISENEPEIAMTADTQIDSILTEKTVEPKKTAIGNLIAKATEARDAIAPADPETTVEKPPLTQEKTVEKPMPKHQVQQQPTREIRQPKEPTRAVTSVKWPALKLTAILAGMEGVENAAIINGKMISEGGEIDGVILKKVQPDGVLLEAENETRFLRMGASL